jgi:predicted nucleotidyltransferase
MRLDIYQASCYTEAVEILITHSYVYLFTTENSKDASTDDTCAVFKRLARGSPNRRSSYNSGALETLIHQQLGGWIMSINEALQASREEILQLASKYGARNVRLFGSRACGEARPDSDVDFLVEMEPGRSLLDLGGLLMDLQDLLGCRVDVVEPEGLHWYIRDTVLKEAVPL